MPQKQIEKTSFTFTKTAWYELPTILLINGFKNLKISITLSEDQYKRVGQAITTLSRDKFHWTTVQF